MSLPKQPQATGGRWKLSDQAVMALMGWEAVLKSEIHGELEKVSEGTAYIKISGKASGAADGVSSEVDLTGALQVDLRRRRIQQFSANVKEDRAISHAQPGFSMSAAVQLSVSPLTVSQHLSEAALGAISLASKREQTPLLHQSTVGRYQLLHGHRWRIVRGGRPTVLRFVDQGDLVAQCNIVDLPDGQANRQVSLKEFQADVERAMGDREVQFLDASRAAGRKRSTILRITVEAVENEIPVRWIHYYVSNAEGRRAAITVVLEKSLVEQFGNEDLRLLESFEFSVPTAGPRQAAQPNTDRK